MQYKQLQSALLDAFQTQPSLEEMVLYAIGRNLSSITTANGLQAIVFYLLRWTEAHDRSIQLILGAREANPDNAALYLVAAQFGIAPDTTNLQHFIAGSNLSLDITEWLKREGRIETTVCRIDVPVGRGYCSGTGFLLGRDVVITNYHLMEPVITARHGSTTINASAAPWKDVALTFDYKSADSHAVVNAGRKAYLAVDDNWLLDWSSYSPLDSQIHARSTPRSSDQLDYVLLRLDSAPGDDLLGTNANPYQRGWLVPDLDYDFPSGAPLIILHHPTGRRLEIACDAIIDRNTNSTRVSYRTSTEGGSSGAPCFTFNWQLVALHHAADPNTLRGHQTEYNQGIPFSSILQLMEQRGTNIYLGSRFAW